MRTHNYPPLNKSLIIFIILLEILGIMRLLLVDQRVLHYKEFVDAAKTDVKVITYSFESDTFASILGRVAAAGAQFESAGIISHSYTLPYYQMTAASPRSTLYNVEQADAALDSWTGYADFLRSLNAPIVDMMACRLFSDSNWKYVFDGLEKRLSIQIRASTDDTGNLSAGGNWVMESDNVNVGSIYFTEAIESYAFLLYDTTYWRSNQLNTSNPRYGNKAVVTWGSAFYGGGDSSAVATRLKSQVTSIYSTETAFAALKTDGSVVTWGISEQGGNSSLVASQLTADVSCVYSTYNAFAALKTDGSVVTWGFSEEGGNSSLVASQLTNVTAIYSTGYAFAALKSDGSVVTWGGYGGNSSDVQSQLTNVTAIYSNNQAFAALKTDGSVVTWGTSEYGGNSLDVQSQLTNVTAIYSASSAFAALKTDGSVVTWGISINGGNSLDVQSQLTNVIAIYSTGTAFAALKTDGSVVTWGLSFNGGNSSDVQSQLTNVTTIYSTGTAFAALKTDGSVVTWGLSGQGGNSSDVQSQLTNVTAIYSTEPAFAALKTDGSVVTWGNSGYGGNSLDVQSQLTNVTAIYSNMRAFAALKSDGSVVTWGFSEYGGNSSTVASQLTSDVATIYSDIYSFAALRTPNLYTFPLFPDNDSQPHTNYYRFSPQTSQINIFGKYNQNSKANNDKISKILWFNTSKYVNIIDGSNFIQQSNKFTLQTNTIVPALNSPYENFYNDISANYCDFSITNLIPGNIYYLEVKTDSDEPGDLAIEIYNTNKTGVALTRTSEPTIEFALLNYPPNGAGTFGKAPAENGYTGIDYSQYPTWQNFKIVSPANIPPPYENPDGSATDDGDALIDEQMGGDALSALTAECSGNAVLIQRGVTTFLQKITNAQTAGAKMVIIYNRNNDGDNTFNLGDGNSTITIPSIFIGNTVGESILTNIRANVRLYVSWITENQITIFQQAYDIITGPTTIGDYFDTVKDIVTDSNREAVKQYVADNKTYFESLVEVVPGNYLTNFIVSKAAGYDETAAQKLLIIADDQTVNLAPYLTDLVSGTTELYLFGLTGDQITLTIEGANYTISIVENGASYNSVFYGVGDFIVMGQYRFTVKCFGSVGGPLGLPPAPPTTNGGGGYYKHPSTGARNSGDYATYLRNKTIFAGKTIQTKAVLDGRRPYVNLSNDGAASYVVKKNQGARDTTVSELERYLE
jgi:hypothetical protein